MYLKLLSYFTLFVCGQSLIKDCDPTSIFRPTTLELSPDPPIPGKQITLTVIFDNTGAPITDGYVSTSLSINYIPFTPSTVPLCQDTSCPIVSGINDRSTTTMFPSISGLVKSRVTWTGTQGESLLCIDTAVKVSPALTWNILGLLKSILKNNKKEIEELHHFFGSSDENKELEYAETHRAIRHSLNRIYDKNKKEIQTLYKKIEYLTEDGNINELEEGFTRIPEVEHETV